MFSKVLYIVTYIQETCTRALTFDNVLLPLLNVTKLNKIKLN